MRTKFALSLLKLMPNTGLKCAMLVILANSMALTFQTKFTDWIQTYAHGTQLFQVQPGRKMESKLYRLNTPAWPSNQTNAIYDWLRHDQINVADLILDRLSTCTMVPDRCNYFLLHGSLRPIRSLSHQSTFSLPTLPRDCRPRFFYPLRSLVCKIYCFLAIKELNALAPAIRLHLGHDKTRLL